MNDPCIICVAITGSVARKEHNPAVPISIAEQIESTQEAYEAGASIAHLHVRGENQSPSSEPAKFEALRNGLMQHCPGMIIQFSTGGRSGAGKERGGMLSIGPDMASLSVGSNNFPTRVYENPPDLIDWLASEMITYDVRPEIEVFDLSHLFQAHRMLGEGKFTSTPYIQFVMGVKNAMPVDRQVFDFYVETTKRLFGEGAQWCAAGVGAGQHLVNQWAVSRGGHIRTGLEDNLRLSRDQLAPSNAALVMRARSLCDEAGRDVATCTQARKLLGLRPHKLRMHSAS